MAKATQQEAFVANLQEQAKAMEHQSQLHMQPVGYVMTRIPGTECDVPAMVFSAQQEQQPVQRTPLREALAAAKSRKDSDSESGDKSTTAPKVAMESPPDGITLEEYGGELPSVGSADHFNGSCKRCAFFSKGRCKNGKDCSHCHFGHEARSRLRKRNGAQRARRSMQEVPELFIQYEDEPSNGLDVLEEVLSYLTEPAGTVTMEDIAAAVESDSEDEAAAEDRTPEGAAVDAAGPGAASIIAFNNALQAACMAYGDAAETVTPVKEVCFGDFGCEGSDVDTTPSVSGASAVSTLSDTEKGSTSDASDSEGSPTSAPTPTSTRSWSSMLRARKAMTSENCTVQDVERMTRSLLNKLTAERFESLCTQVLALPLSTPDHLAVVSAEIFKKATSQDCFRSLYTQLCLRLDAHLEKQTSSIGGRAFRKALVNECQATFERHLQPADASLFTDLNEEESFELQVKLKTRRLGNMRFIGDLLVNKLLAPKLLPPILHELLDSDEDCLESAVALLTVVAPQFESQSSLYQAPVRSAFQVLRTKMTAKAVCPRMQFQIKDLFDARARNWVSRTACA